MAPKLRPPSPEATAAVPWLAWLPSRQFRVIGVVSSVDEVPARLPRKAVVVVEGPRGPSWVAFDCPCSRRHRVLVPVSTHAFPHWRLVSERPFTLHPSIDIITHGVRCHYWIRGGSVLWAP